MVELCEQLPRTTVILSTLLSTRTRTILCESYATAFTQTILSPGLTVLRRGSQLLSQSAFQASNFPPRRTWSTSRARPSDTCDTSMPSSALSALVIVKLKTLSEQSCIQATM